MHPLGGWATTRRRKDYRAGSHMTSGPLRRPSTLPNERDLKFQVERVSKRLLARVPLAINRSYSLLTMEYPRAREQLWFLQG